MELNHRIPLIGWLSALSYSGLFYTLPTHRMESNHRYTPRITIVGAALYHLSYSVADIQ